MSKFYDILGFRLQCHCIYFYLDEEVATSLTRSQHYIYYVSPVLAVLCLYKLFYLFQARTRLLILQSCYVFYDILSFNYSNSLLSKKHQQISALVSWRRSTLEKYLVRELKKGNSDTSVCSLICGLRCSLNCQQHSQGQLVVIAYGWNILLKRLNHMFT